MAKLTWHMYAGGVGARDGVHGYKAVTPFGDYSINPSGMRRVVYVTYFINSKGLLPGGLWQLIGRFHSPNAAKGASKSHFENVLGTSGAMTENPRKGGYRVVIEAAPGNLLLGGVKKTVSSVFQLKEDAATLGQVSKEINEGAGVKVASVRVIPVKQRAEIVRRNGVVTIAK